MHAGTSPRSRLFAAQSADLALVAVRRPRARGRHPRGAALARLRVGPRRPHAEGHRAGAADRGGDRASTPSRSPTSSASSCRSPRTGPTARPRRSRRTARSPSSRTSSGVDLAGALARPGGHAGARRRVQRRRAGARRDRRRAHRPQPVGRAAADAAAPRRRGIRERVDDRRHGRRDRRPSSRHGATRAPSTGSTCSRPCSRAQFEAFALQVVPELQRRGLFPTEYEGETLREHLGLARPENVHAAGDPVVAARRGSARARGSRRRSGIRRADAAVVCRNVSWCDPVRRAAVERRFRAIRSLVATPAIEEHP